MALVLAACVGTPEPTPVPTTTMEPISRAGGKVEFKQLVTDDMIVQNALTVQGAASFASTITCDGGFDLNGDPFVLDTDADSVVQG